MLFWDACTIIYFVEARDPWHAALVEQLRELGEDHTRHAVSQLSLLECRVQPLRDRDQRTLADFDRFFAAADLHQVPLSEPVIRHATELQATYNLKTPDALQAASALSLPGDVLFLTNDARFSRLPELNAVQIG